MLSKGLLSIYCISDAVLGAGDADVKEITPQGADILVGVPDRKQKGENTYMVQ